MANQNGKPTTKKNQFCTELGADVCFVAKIFTTNNSIGNVGISGTDVSNQHLRQKLRLALTWPGEEWDPGIRVYMVHHG